MSYLSVWLTWIVLSAISFVIYPIAGLCVFIGGFWVSLMLCVIISNKRWDVPKKQRPRTFIPNSHHDIEQPRPAPEITFMPPSAMPPNVGQSQAEYELAVAQVLARKYKRKKTNEQE